MPPSRAPIIIDVAGLEVRAVVDGRLQALEERPEPLDRDPVADRVEGGGQEALHAVGEGIHPGRGRQRRRGGRGSAPGRRSPRWAAGRGSGRSSCGRSGGAGSGCRGRPRSPCRRWWGSRPSAASRARSAPARPGSGRSRPGGPGESTSSRMALAASIGLPPPSPTRPSHPASRYRARPARTSASVGIRLDIGVDDRRRPSGGDHALRPSPWRSKPASVTISGRWTPSRPSSAGEPAGGPRPEEDAVREREDRPGRRAPAGGTGRRARSPRTRGSDGSSRSGPRGRRGMASGSTVVSCASHRPHPAAPAQPSESRICSISAAACQSPRRLCLGHARPSGSPSPPRPPRPRRTTGPVADRRRSAGRDRRRSTTAAAAAPPRHPRRAGIASPGRSGGTRHPGSRPGSARASIVACDFSGMRSLAFPCRPLDPSARPSGRPRQPGPGS